MRVAISGASGRLGRALVAALEEAPFAGPAGPIPWRRPAFDLDAPDAFPALLDRDRPEVVIHAAAWTDVDACAREPGLALARNGAATGELARAAAERGIDLIIVSTNEVFDGTRTDERGYAATDTPSPINAYGMSKLAGERLAEAAFTRAASSLGIVRTAWLFGPPGNDFPDKILAAAERARVSGEPLKLVADETGSPTYTPDLAESIAELIEADAIEGIRHIVNAGYASRATWAEEVLRQAGVSVPTQSVQASEWQRDSTPPLWAALEPTPAPSGRPLRTWPEALADYMPTLERGRAAAARSTVR